MNNPGSSDPSGDASDPTIGIHDLIDDTLTDEDFDTFANGDDEFGLGAPTMPPPPRRVPVQDRLVRDPTTTLGGVCSGIARFYGLDVSLVRLGTLLFAFVTGFGFLAYFLAWLIIPKAGVWPPPGAPRRRNFAESGLSGKQAVIAGSVLVISLIWGLGNGPGQVLVPAALIAGGVWLLSKSPSAATQTTAATPPAPTPTIPPAPDGGFEPPIPTITGRTYQSYSYVPPPPGPTMATPIAKRSLFRNLLRAGIVMLILIVPLALLAGAALVAFPSDISLTSGEAYYAPDTASELRPIYEVDAGSLELDLRNLSSDDFDQFADVEVNVKIGEVRVIIPDDLIVAVETRTKVGEVTLFEQTSDGIKNELSVNPANPDIRLSVNVDAGSIEIVRDNGAVPVRPPAPVQIEEIEIN